MPDQRPGSMLPVGLYCTTWVEYFDRTKFRAKWESFHHCMMRRWKKSRARRGGKKQVQKVESCAGAVVVSIRYSRVYTDVSGIPNLPTQSGLLQKAWLSHSEGSMAICRSPQCNGCQYRNQVTVCSWYPNSHLS